MKRKYHIYKGVILALLIILTLPLQAADLEQGLKLLEQAHNRGNFNQSYMIEMENIIYENGKEDKAQLRVYLYQGGERQLATFVKPESLKDHRYLVVGYNTWMYQDGLRRPIRVSANQRLFGDAGIGETVGLDYYNDYQIETITKKGQHYLLELKANEPQMAYQSAEVRISEAGYFKKVILMDSGRTELRRISYGDYRELNGHQVADLTIEDLLQNRDRKTELRYLDIQKLDLPSRLFQSNRMGDIELILNSL